MPKIHGMKHRPVLLQEVLNYLSPQDGETIIDATFGAGGHSNEILKRLGPSGKLLAFDINPEVISHPDVGLALDRNRNLTLVHANFSELKPQAEANGIESIDGALFDLGLSSDILDDPKRGFTFQSKGPLDMRFDLRQKMTAADLIRASSAQELAKILREYGEEPNASRIAREIKRSSLGPQNTFSLYEMIETALPKPIKHKAKDAARRVFQAIRIAVNNELENLTSGLNQALELLRPKGRMVVISFHSLEDRIVKQSFNEWARGCVCPPEAPECICGKKPLVKILTKKPVTATESELSENSRARSAKLRAAAKL